MFWGALQFTIHVMTARRHDRETLDVILGFKLSSMHSKHFGLVVSFCGFSYLQFHTHGSSTQVQEARFPRVSRKVSASASFGNAIATLGIPLGRDGTSSLLRHSGFCDMIVPRWRSSQPCRDGISDQL